ncbi:hypothetical protein CLOM_g418 [Closterium sp. NIES-68]|nr:hypothetical protein CLOM_g418 [Closterium sp. NIES-68]
MSRRLGGRDDRGPAGRRSVVATSKPLICETFEAGSSRVSGLMAALTFEGAIADEVARATPEYYYPLEVLIQKNDAADHMFVICSGTVQEASCVHGEGKDEHLATLTAGNMCGEVALLCNILQPFTVTAKELCQVLRIDRQSLAIVTSLFIVDGRRMVDNLLQRSEEAGSKFAGLVAEIEGLVAAQEADLTVSTIYAAWTGDMEQLQQLMAAGAKADRADYDGRTPLVGPVFSLVRISMGIYTAWTGDMQQLQQLMAAGAKADRADYDGRTPLVGL